MASNRKSVQFRLGDANLTWLKAYAEKKEITMSEALNRIIEEKRGAK